MSDDVDVSKLNEGDKVAFTVAENSDAIGRKSDKVRMLVDRVEPMDDGSYHIHGENMDTDSEELIDTSIDDITDVSMIE